MNDKVFVKESFKILNGIAAFKDDSVDEVQNVEVYSKVNVDSWVEELQAEIERLKKKLEQTEANNELQGKSLEAHSELITKFRKENKRLKDENKDFKSKLRDNGDWICNGNEEQSAIDSNQSWGIFG